jgi:hypothetical protein
MREASLCDESGGSAENALRLSVEHLEGHGYKLFSHLHPFRLEPYPFPLEPCTTNRAATGRKRHHERRVVYSSRSAVMGSIFAARCAGR